MRHAAALLLVVAAAALGIAPAGCSAGATDEQGAKVAHYTVRSQLLGRELRQTAIVPPRAQGERRPLLVFLHGATDSDRGEDASLDDEPLFATLRALGDRAPIVVFPHGGNFSYWHDRKEGRWGSYVVREAIPQAIRRFGADPRRVAIGGISMGGFGALSLARRHPRRFCAVGGHSPALWETYDEAFDEAFDGPADFARHDLLGAARRDPGAFRGRPLWVDAGDRDWFIAGFDAFVAALRRANVPVTTRRPPGGHENGYWRRHWPSYLRFYATALARCRR